MTRITVSIKMRLLVALLVLAVVDAVLPVPVVALILVFVLLERPAWFSKAFHAVYGREP